MLKLCGYARGRKSVFTACKPSREVGQFTLHSLCWLCCGQGFSQAMGVRWEDNRIHNFTFSRQQVTLIPFIDQMLLESYRTVVVMFSYFASMCSDTHETDINKRFLCALCAFHNVVVVLSKKYFMEEFEGECASWKVPTPYSSQPSRLHFLAAFPWHAKVSLPPIFHAW